MASLYSTGDLPEMILSAVAKYQLNFEQLSTDVEKWVARIGVQLQPGELEGALEQLIAGGHIQAYELSTEPPHEKKVPYLGPRVHELWYRATTQGLALLQRLEQGDPKPWWPE